MEEFLSNVFVMDITLVLYNVVCCIYLLKDEKNAVGKELTGSMLFLGFRL